MAIPTQPTLATIVQEGLKKAGYPAGGSATQQTRANGFVQEVLNDIWTEAEGKELLPLMATSYGVTTDGVSRYAMPSDMAHIMSLQILKGTLSGTAQSSTASQVVLAAGTGPAANSIQGKLILITSGTYIGNCSQVSAISTDTVTVTPDFQNSGVTGTVPYLIIDSHVPLEEDSIKNRDKISNPYSGGTPETYYFVGQASADSDETGEVEFFPVPTDTWGIQLRYYVNLTLTDLTSNLMKTLYRRWYNAFVYGVAYKQLETDRDNRYESMYKIYERELKSLVAREIYGQNLSNLQCVVTE